MKNNTSKTVSLVFILFSITGCSTSNLYKSPITEYQSAVNKTIVTVQPYFVELNKVEMEYQLYSAVKLDEDWGTQHMRNAIDPRQIAVRISALQLISDHARLLSEIVNSTAPEDIKKAAETLGQNAQSLANTISKLPPVPVPPGGKAPDFGTPLADIVSFVGKAVIEHKQVDAIEKAILDTEQPITKLMDELEKDLKTTLNLRAEAFAGMTTVRLELFNKARRAAKPENIPGIIDSVVSLGADMDTVASVDVSSLMDEMKSTHKALVKFVKSDKTEGDITSFTDRVDVFSSKVSDVANIVQSLRKL